MSHGDAEERTPPESDTSVETPKPDGKRTSPPRPPGSPVTIEKWGR